MKFQSILCFSALSSKRSPPLKLPLATPFDAKDSKFPHALCRDTVMHNDARFSTFSQLSDLVTIFEPTLIHTMAQSLSFLKGIDIRDLGGTGIMPSAPTSPAL